MSSEPTSLEARHWIDGAWLALGEQGESIDPASGGVIGTFYEADAAIAAASRAFKAPGWRDDRALRARVLNSMAARFFPRATMTWCGCSGARTGRSMRTGIWRRA